jgi:outer membrane protein assembly factor BamB
LHRKVLVSLLLVLAGCRSVPRVPEPALFPLTKKWVETLDDPIQPPLATDGIRSFAASSSGIEAVEIATGTQSWSRTDITGTLSAMPGLLVVRASSGLVHALDPITGKTRWSVRTPRPSVLPAIFDGARVLLAGTRVLALDATTGKTLLDEALVAPAVTTPVAAGGYLLVAEADAALRCYAAATMRLQWFFPTGRPLEAPPAVDGRLVVVGTADRRALALNLENGKKEWTFKIGATVQVAPAITRRLAFVASNEAMLYAFGRGNGHVSWIAPLPSRPLGPPVVVGSKVFIACHADELLGFDLATGEPLGSTHAGVETLDPGVGASEVRAAPLVVPPFVVVGLRNPWAMVALEPGAPPAKPSPPPPFPPDEADALVVIAAPTPTSVPSVPANP